MKNIILALPVLVSLAACAPMTTPSMINNSNPQLSKTMMMEQIKLNDLDSQVLSALATHYKRNGLNALDLTMTYDPQSRDFTATSAARELNRIKNYLKTKNIQNITMQTQAIASGTPSLLVSYDMVNAVAPYDCDIMPGLYRGETTRFLGEYKFGCSVDTMLTRQMAHPSDLLGNDVMTKSDGRRQSIILDTHSRGEPKEPIVGVERDDLVAN